MTLKRFLLMHLQLYCVLVTLIFAASFIVGVIFTPEQELRYSQLIDPFVTAALCVLPTCITYFKKEPTLPQYIIRHMIQMVLIEALVLWMISPPEGVDNTLFSLMIGVIVLVIYVLAKLVIWLQKTQESKKLTEQLKSLQQGELNHQ